MKNRDHWDVNRFAEINLPEVIGEISDKEEFSKPHGIRVLDMPVMMPGEGLRIPEMFPLDFKNVLSKVIKSVIDHEQSLYGDIEDHYVYVTIDQKMVKGGNTGRRAGAHSDAYIERDNRQIDITEKAYPEVSQEEGEISHTYVVTDCLPTEFFNVPFPLKEVDCESSLKTFDEIANSSEPVTYGLYNILKLTPYVVHRSAVAHEDTYRTFIKVSVSKKKYCREGNTHNPRFEYQWTMRPRNEIRNHPW